MKTFVSLILLALAPACAEEAKTPVTDDFSELTGLDEKSDSFSAQMVNLGTLTYGQTSASKLYRKSPKYRAYKFDGVAGDKIDISVRSSDGDSVAWLVDKSFKVIAFNDDADNTTYDSHITATLPPSSSTTHWIIYRDYSYATAHFTVELRGPSWNTSCQIDADCVAVSRGGCCPNGLHDAVSVGAESDYAAAHACTITPHPICPLAVILDRRVAQCNFASHQCEMVAPEDIRCGGFTAHPHQCPADYRCQLPISMPDVPGSCVPSN